VAQFRVGRSLLDAGNVDAACSKLAESQRLDPSSGTLLNLAACHEKQGKTATAWAEYLAAARLAQTQGKTDRVAEAKRKASELEPRLSYLTVRTTTEVAGIEIRRDDVVLEASSVGSKIPVDPGKHVVKVTAPGYESLSLEVTLGASADAQTLVIPELRKAAAPPPDATPAQQATTAPAAPPPPQQGASAAPADATKSGSSSTLGWIIGGAGVAVAATGGVFGVLALSAYSSADKACPTHTACSADAMTDRRHADTRATIANVGVGVGIVGIGVGTFLLLTSSSKPAKESPHARVEPTADPHGAGLQLTGAF
jgi:hypothetical protein